MSHITSTTINANKEITPIYALVFYAEGNKLTPLMATRHSIKKDNTLGLGKVVSPKSIAKNISLSLGVDDNQCISLIPDNVLLDTDTLLSWHTPRRNIDMWFRSGEKLTCVQQVELPPLVSKIRSEEKNISRQKA